MLAAAILLPLRKRHPLGHWGAQSLSKYADVVNYACINNCVISMPYRAVVSAQLGKLFGVLSHPVRIRILEELQREDLTVGSLKEILHMTHPAVSQQLAVLRSYHLVVENRQGRNVYYHLRKPELAKWIMGGLSFISPDTTEAEEMMSAIENVRTVWGNPEVAKAKSKVSRKKTQGQR